MQSLLASPRGFCAGVKRAINTVEYALKIYGRPVYVRHEIVHNRYIVNKLCERGVIFVEKINEVPDYAVLIFSAHGVSKKVRNEAMSRKLIIFDATCPLVTKVHMQVTRVSRRGEDLILIGHKDHPEVDGIIGNYDNQDGRVYLIESLGDVSKLKIKNKRKLSLVTQTTLSIDDTSSIIKALCDRFPEITSPRDYICYATTNRQMAVRILVKQVDIVLVVGASNSSNSNRLVELAQNMGKNAYLIDDATDIQDIWLRKVSYVGITSGASTPDILVQNVVTRLRELGNSKTEFMLNRYKEDVFFKIPKGIYTASYKNE